MLIRNKLSKIVIREYLLIQNIIYIFFFTKFLEAYQLFPMCIIIILILRNSFTLEMETVSFHN